MSEIDLAWLDTDVVGFPYRPFFFFFLGDHKLMYFVFLLLLVLQEGRVSPEIWLRVLRAEQGFPVAAEQRE